MPKILRKSPEVFAYGTGYLQLIDGLSKKEKRMFLDKVGLKYITIKSIIENDFVTEGIAHRLHHATYGKFILYDIKHRNTEHEIFFQPKLERVRKCRKRVMLIVDILKFFKAKSLHEPAKYFDFKLNNSIDISNRGYLSEAHSYRIYKGTYGKIPMIAFRKVKSLGDKLPKKVKNSVKKK